MRLQFTFLSLLIVSLGSCQEKNSKPLEENSNSNTIENIEKPIAFNEVFLTELKTIRETPYTGEDQLIKIEEETTLSFPDNYTIVKQKSAGTYILSLSDSLSFNAEDENLIQYQIESKNGVNGRLNVLNKPNLNYNFQETITDIKERQDFYSLKLIDADNFGYMYEYFNEYHILRYFKINDTHYAYSIDFDTLKECVLEFDRSKNMRK